MPLCRRYNIGNKMFFLRNSTHSLRITKVNKWIKIKIWWSKIETQKQNYLLVKNIPAQKLATQSRRAHFLCRTFLALSSTAPPLLFIDIFPAPLVPHLTIINTISNIQNCKQGKKHKIKQMQKKRSKLNSFCGTKSLPCSLGAREEDPLRPPLIFHCYKTVPFQQTPLYTTNENGNNIYNKKR